MLQCHSVHSNLFCSVAGGSLAAQSTTNTSNLSPVATMAVVGAAYLYIEAMQNPSRTVEPKDTITKMDRVS